MRQVSGASDVSCWHVQCSWMQMGLEVYEISCTTVPTSLLTTCAAQQADMQVHLT